MTWEWILNSSEYVSMSCMVTVAQVFIEKKQNDRNGKTKNMYHSK